MSVRRFRVSDRIGQEFSLYNWKNKNLTDVRTEVVAKTDKRWYVLPLRPRIGQYMFMERKMLALWLLIRHHSILEFEGKFVRHIWMKTIETKIREVLLETCKSYDSLYNELLYRKSVLTIYLRSPMEREIMTRPILDRYETLSLCKTTIFRKSVIIYYRIQLSRSKNEISAQIHSWY